MIFSAFLALSAGSNGGGQRSFGALKKSNDFHDHCSIMRF